MDPLTPIPTPPAQRWREFRIQALPILTFIAAVAAIAVLWQRYVFPSNIVAQVDAETANVITTQLGTIEELRVERFQQVAKGDVIAVINPGDTNLLAATLHAVEADLAVLQERIDSGEVRAGQTYENTRLTYLEQLAQLQVSRINAKLAEAEFNMQKELFAGDTPLVASNKYLVALYKWQAALTNVVEMEKFLAEKEKTLPRLRAENSNAVSVINEAVAAQKKVLTMTASNIIIRAPIDGVITAVSNVVGSRVMPGASICTISSTKPERIIAYMRPPISHLPTAGDTLEVRRRSFKRQTAVATIKQVGSQLEPIAPALAVLTGTSKIDLGLPFEVTLPPKMGLLPGEVVDIIYEPKR
jgi:multidrug resistance efflux pump